MIVKLTTSILLLLVCTTVTGSQTPQTKQIRVAVIDTGIDKSLAKENFLCKKGHRDFTGTGIYDTNGHGTHISGLIDQHAKSKIIGVNSQREVLNTKANYCQVIIKFYDNNSKVKTLYTGVKAFKHAIKLKVDYINYSAGGETYSAEEHAFIKIALDAGIKVIVAAGNEGNNIDVVPYYPAKLDSRLIVVGNLNSKSEKSSKSNYGRSVNAWEFGEARISYATRTTLRTMTGTSQATAVRTGKLIQEQLKSSH